MQVTVNKKGYLVLEAKEFHLTPGMSVHVGWNGRSVVITPVRSAFVARLMEAADTALQENQPLFGVPVREYVRLSDEERDSLWEQAERRADP
jgi:hypothetical protein